MVTIPLSNVVVAGWLLLTAAQAAQRFQGMGEIKTRAATSAFPKRLVPELRESGQVSPAWILSY